MVAAPKGGESAIAQLDEREPVGRLRELRLLVRLAPPRRDVAEARQGRIDDGTRDVAVGGRTCDRARAPPRRGRARVRDAPPSSRGSPQDRSPGRTAPASDDRPT